MKNFPSISNKLTALYKLGLVQQFNTSVEDNGVTITVDAVGTDGLCHWLVYHLADSRVPAIDPLRDIAGLSGCLHPDGSFLPATRHLAKQQDGTLYWMTVTGPACSVASTLSIVFTKIVRPPRQTLRNFDCTVNIVFNPALTTIATNAKQEHLINRELQVSYARGSHIPVFVGRVIRTPVALYVATDAYNRTSIVHVKKVLVTDYAGQDHWMTHFANDPLTGLPMLETSWDTDIDLAHPPLSLQ